MSDVLNLGCGNRPIDGAVNHDIVAHRPEVTVVHDLNVLPWPWPDNSFDTIVALAVFEHLEHNLFVNMDECWRILRPGGLISLKLPHWNSDISYRDPSHRWFFSIHGLDMFDPDTKYGRDYEFYPMKKWKIVHGPELNKAGSSIHATLQVRK
ncbi:MAG: methyltransferase domain-containing protein [Sideroxydans sp.]|nr:methyltransferase domain-containing protein [Sideroxydans sp.]